MSTRSYTKHIPDFRLVTHHAEAGDSPVHRMNPWTKAALLATVVAFATVLTDAVLLSILLLACIGVYALARLPFGLLVGWLTLPVMFVVTLAIMFVFTEPGDEVAGIDIMGERVSVSDHGVIMLYKLLVRALAVVTFSLTMFMSTRYAHIAHMAQRLLPGALASVFLLSYRFMFVASDEVTDVIDAMNARSARVVKGVVRQSKTYAGIFGLSFLHAFERAEDIAKAMESRGFTGEMPVSASVPRPGPGGVATVTVSCALLAIATYSRYFDPDLLRWW